MFSWHKPSFHVKYQIKFSQADSKMKYYFFAVISLKLAECLFAAARCPQMEPALELIINCIIFAPHSRSWV